MASTADSSAAHRTGALSRLLLAPPPSKEPDIGPETLLSAVLDAAADGIMVIGALGRVLTYNDRFVEIWDMPRDILMTREERQVHSALVKHLKDPGEFLNHVDSMAADAEARAQGLCRLIDGRIIEHETRPVAVLERTIGRVWTFRDITSRVRAFEMLRESEERFRIFADSAAYGILMHQDGDVVYANEAAARELGYSATELIGLPVADLIPEEDRPPVRARGGRPALSRDGASATRYEARVRRKDGQIRLVELGVSAIRLEDKTAVVMTIVDLTERRKAEAEALHLASHDPLTDLPNRAFFRNATDDAIHEAKRANSCLSVILIGLDRFKSANFMGHRLGDLVLQEAGQRLFSLIRPVDLVARLGADEFAVLLKGCDVGSSIVLSQQIVASLREPYRIAHDNELFLSASVGTASFPHDATDTAELLRHANIALVAAKERGKDQAVSFESDLTSEAAARLEMNRFLHRSLRDHAFFLEFQPIARTRDLGVTGFEALVRSKDLLGRRVPPDAFIPIAEATGLVVPMGRIVVDLALAAIRELNLRRATPLRMAINASAIQLRHPSFVRDIRSGLDRHGLPASSLAVEVTETNALTDPEGTRRVLRELRAAGIAISLDDFGTGFASLDLLRSLPLDLVKIDRSFTRDVDTDGTQGAIVTSVIELSHRLDLKVVAEGVETESQQRFLLAHGCDLIQGYWLARPLSLESSLEFLQSGDRRIRA
jgi:diguanylate cyclase (GGDEF)-like protein/PAS domain S-box-containing protein